MSSMRGINLQSYCSEVVICKFEFHVACTMEVLEDSF